MSKLLPTSTKTLLIPILPMLEAVNVSGEVLFAAKYSVPKVLTGEAKELSPRKNVEEILCQLQKVYLRQYYQLTYR